MERKSLYFTSKVVPVKPINNEFTLCKVYVCALGKNRNFSHIGKESSDDAMPTLCNIPVVGHLYKTDDGKYVMGGHDMVIEKDGDSWKFKSLCVPYGVIPQQENFAYEEVEEPNGRGKHTYLTADAILWTGRYPELKDAIYSDECWFGQSMEINILDYAPLEEDKNYSNILKYSYSALCLLGKSDAPEFHTEPCFPESRVSPYEFALQNAQFAELMDQFKSELKECFADNDKGEEKMDNFENNVPEVEETTENFENNNANAPDAEVPVVEPEQAPEAAQTFEAESQQTPAEPPVAFASTYKEKRQAICNALPNKDECDDNGDLTYSVHYYLCDFDDKYAYVEKSEYTRDDNGSNYTENKGRFEYAFNEETKTVTISGEFVAMFVTWLTKEEVDKVEQMRNEYEELVEYKRNRCKADLESAIDAAINEFADLEGNDEFATVVENRYSYENVEALKTACYIIRGKFSVPAPKKKEVVEVSIPFGDRQEPTIYEEFFSKYGNKRKSR